MTGLAAEMECSCFIENGAEVRGLIFRSLINKVMRFNERNKTKNRAIMNKT